jgi:2-C-methyl-D-erythritol 4-phosphate cytidylyltransferase
MVARKMAFGLCATHWQRDTRSTHTCSSFTSPFSAPHLVPLDPSRRSRLGPSHWQPVATVSPTSSSPKLQPADVAVILLAGGVGSRMKADRPKQFLELAGRTVLEHSLALFCWLPEVAAVVLVIEPEFRDRFAAAVAAFSSDAPLAPLVFADPGKERQDSVLSGLRAATDLSLPAGVGLVCVHDSARPLVTPEEVRNVLADARIYGAAVLGVPSKATIKESENGLFVLRTIARERLWEIQTPQVVRPDLLMRGFEKVRAENLAVTDDVSVVEYLGEPVKLTLGEYTNIKITTPEDMDIAHSILRQRSSADAAISPTISSI